MKKSKFTESQIVFALKQSETGVKTEVAFYSLMVQWTIDLRACSPMGMHS